MTKLYFGYPNHEFRVKISGNSNLRVRPLMPINLKKKKRVGHDEFTAKIAVGFNGE